MNVLKQTATCCNYSDPDDFSFFSADVCRDNQMSCHKKLSDQIHWKIKDISFRMEEQLSCSLCYSFLGSTSFSFCFPASCPPIAPHCSSFPHVSLGGEGPDWEQFMNLEWEGNVRAGLWFPEKGSQEVLGSWPGRRACWWRYGGWTLLHWAQLAHMGGLKRYMDPSPWGLTSCSGPGKHKPVVRVNCLETSG